MMVMLMVILVVMLAGMLIVYDNHGNCDLSVDDGNIFNICFLIFQVRSIYYFRIALCFWTIYILLWL